MHPSSLTNKNHLISLKMSRSLLSYLAAKFNIKLPAQKRKKSFIFCFLLSLLLIIIYSSNPISLAKARNIIPQERSQFIHTGEQISVNGRKFPVAWSQWYRDNNLHTGISDTGAMRFLGLELLSTDDPKIQPIEWFSSQTTETVFKSPYRYLDLSDLAQKYRWQLDSEDKTLIINAPPAKIKNIRTERKIDREKIILLLDRPAFWQVFQNKKEAILNIAANTSVKQRDLFDLERAENLTKFKFNLPENKRLKITTFTQPDRIVLELRHDVMREKDIQWTNNIRWQAQYVDLNNSFLSRNKLLNKIPVFPVVWLEIDPQKDEIEILPIASNKNAIEGTLRVVKTAKENQAIAAINGGFFNRNNELPLGAIRSQGKWLSGPILNRGAIAWDAENNFKIDRLRLEETLITTTGDRLPITLLNSAYLQPGIARYTPEWGEFYTPLSDRETIIIVDGERIIRKLAGGKALVTKFPIPKNGYILTLRKEDNLARKLKEGTKIYLATSTVPNEFGNYSEIIGAGPMLIQNSQIVLDSKAEKFSNFFGKQAAIRSAIGITKQGKIILVAVGKPDLKKGATLNELAKILQQLGAIEALNLDGGSSTSLYLGGQLINPDLIPVARVHNSIGVFLKK